MSIALRKRSRLKFADLLLVDGYEFWDMLEFPELVSQYDDTVYTVRGGDRIDLIANDLYGDPALWFILALANNLNLIPVDLKEGSLLRVPSARYITALYTKTNN